MVGTISQQRLLLDNSRTRLDLELNADHVAQEIQRYIGFKVSNLASLRDSESLRFTASQTILRKFNGTFLWVALVV